VLGGGIRRRFLQFFGSFIEQSEFPQTQYAPGEQGCDFFSAIFGRRGAHDGGGHVLFSGSDGGWIDFPSC
jgi:hypothetical protein